MFSSGHFSCSTTMPEVLPPPQRVSVMAMVRGSYKTSHGIQICSKRENRLVAYIHICWKGPMWLGNSCSTIQPPLDKLKGLGGSRAPQDSTLVEAVTKSSLRRLSHSQV